MQWLCRRQGRAALAAPPATRGLDHCEVPPGGTAESRGGGLGHPRRQPARLRHAGDRRSTTTTG
ncbi:hypothetical protein ACTMU2_08500 [Cupriavidus basilensis]